MHNLRGIKLLLFSLMILLLISGCSSNETTSDDDLFQYKDSFVGDNSAVGNIVNQLPGAEHLKSFELKTKEEPYGIILNFDGMQTEQVYKETVIYQATFLFALIQNVNWITFNSEFGESTIRKEDLQEWYGQELNNAQNEDELRDMIQENLNDEKEII